MNNLIKKKSIIILIIVISIFSKMPIYAGSKTININGKLINNDGLVVKGNHKLSFRLYDSELGGESLWNEDYQMILNEDGFFQVPLGSINSLDGVNFDKQYYIGITIDDGEELMPRQKLASSPYALGSLGDFNVNNNLKVNGTIDSTVLNINNNASIGSDNGSTKLHLFGRGGKALFIEGSPNSGNIDMGIDVLSVYGGKAYLTLETTVGGGGSIWGNYDLTDHSKSVKIGSIDRSQTWTTFHGNGNVQVGSISPGNDAPAIKCKKITDWTGEEDKVTFIPHGLIGSKILDIRAKIEFTHPSAEHYYVFAEHPHSGRQFSLQFDDTRVWIMLRPGNSSGIAGKPVTILIWYEA